MAKEEILHNRFIFGFDTNNKIKMIARVLKLGGKTIEELVALKKDKDPSLTYVVYYGDFPSADKQLYQWDPINECPEIDTDGEAEFDVLAQKKEAQEYLDKTDRFVARAYEKGTDIPANILKLRNHYRAFLDGGGSFSNISQETDDKITELGI